MSSSIIVIGRVALRYAAALALLLLPGGVLLFAGAILAMRRRPLGSVKSNLNNTFQEESVRCVASP